LLANDLCRQAIEKGKLTLSSNGCQYRDFVCLSDVEDVIDCIAKRGVNLFKKNIYNLGAGSSLRVLDIAKAISDIYLEIFGNKIMIETPIGSLNSDEPELHYKIDRLLSEGIVIQNDFKKELRQLLLFCSENFGKTA
jgi:UDP-glucose 4-epimerase